MLITPEFENSPLEQQVEKIRFTFIGQAEAYRNESRDDPNKDYDHQEQIKEKKRLILQDALISPYLPLESTQAQKQIEVINRIFDIFLDRIGPEASRHHEFLSEEEYDLSTTALGAQALRDLGKITQEQYEEFMTSKGFEFGKKGGRRRRPPNQD